MVGVGLARTEPEAVAPRPLKIAVAARYFFTCIVHSFAWVDASFRGGYVCCIAFGAAGISSGGAKALVGRCSGGVLADLPSHRKPRRGDAGGANLARVGPVIHPGSSATNNIGAVRLIDEIRIGG